MKVHGKAAQTRAAPVSASTAVAMKPYRHDGSRAFGEHSSLRPVCRRPSRLVTRWWSSVCGQEVEDQLPDALAVWSVQHLKGMVAPGQDL